MAKMCDSKKSDKADGGGGGTTGQKSSILFETFDDFGIKSERNRFRLHFKPDATGNEHEFYINGKQFAEDSERFAEIYEKLGCPVDGSLLIEEEDPDDFLQLYRKSHKNLLVKEKAEDRATVEEFLALLTSIHGPPSVERMMEKVESFHRVLPLYNRWSAMAITSGLLDLHTVLMRQHQHRLLSLPSTIKLLHTLCNMRAVDDVAPKQVKFGYYHKEDLVNFPDYPLIVTYEAAIDIHLQHRITQLIVYMAVFGTAALKAADIPSMDVVPEKVKKALFYLAKEIETGKKFQPDRVPNRFLRMLNGNTEQPKQLPDEFTQKMRGMATDTNWTWKA